jgi:hypothetical protein
MKRSFYFKHHFSWEKTIYIVGVPRCGKSTIHNVIASCHCVEALDEPFEICGVAQKSGHFRRSSTCFQHLRDLLAAMMENYFSELVLGRIYNFRRIDKSYILNTKSKSYVRASHRRKGRLDVLNTARKSRYSLLITLNDVQRGLKILESAAPNPIFLYITRNLEDVAKDIAAKGWMKDSTLARNCHLSPAHSLVVRKGKRKLYVPHIIPSGEKNAFLKASSYERACLFAQFEALALEKSLQALRSEVITLPLERVASQPDIQMNLLIKNLKLIKGPLTETAIAGIQMRHI